YSPSASKLDYSGLLSTEGGLVFGASGGVFFALDADTGREAWQVSLGGKTKAAPISFLLDGRQVIAVAAGRALFLFWIQNSVQNRVSKQHRPVKELQPRIK